MAKCVLAALLASVWALIGTSCSVVQAARSDAKADFVAARARRAELQATTARSTGGNPIDIQLRRERVATRSPEHRRPTFIDAVSGQRKTISVHLVDGNPTTPS